MPARKQSVKPPTHGGVRPGAGRPRTTDRRHAISVRVSPAALAVYESWPAGERAARLSALLERAAKVDVDAA